LRSLGATLALALLGFACALEPESADETPDQPVPEGPARLTVYRPEKGMLTPHKPLPTQLDGKLLAGLQRDQYVSVALPPGEHRLTIPGRSTGLLLEPGETLYCRISGVPDRAVLVWDLRCSADPDENSDVDTCGKGALDPDGNWQE
jgi:hypothetical protein